MKLDLSSWRNVWISVELDTFVLTVTGQTQRMKCFDLVSLKLNFFGHKLTPLLMSLGCIEVY